jgi:hypothetical protein
MDSILSHFQPVPISVCFTLILSYFQNIAELLIVQLQRSIALSVKGVSLSDRYRFKLQSRNLRTLHNIQTGSEAHSALYPKGVGGYFSGDKAAQREANYSPI